MKWIIGRRGCSGDAFWEIAFYSFMKWKSCDLLQPNQLIMECSRFVVGRNLWRSSCPTPTQVGSSTAPCPRSCPVGPSVIDTIHPGELDVNVWLLEISGSPAPQLRPDLGQTQCQVSPSKINYDFHLLSNLDGPHKLPMVSLVTWPQANSFDSLCVWSQLPVVVRVAITLTILHN